MLQSSNALIIAAIYLAEPVASPSVKLSLGCQRRGVRFRGGHVRHPLARESFHLGREHANLLVAVPEATASPMPPSEQVPA